MPRCMARGTVPRIHWTSAGPAMDTLYLQLEPCARHRPFVQHLYIVKDCGRMTDHGSSRFSSPYRNICVVKRLATTGTADVGACWNLIDSPPHYGHRPRRRPLHGWVFGFKCFPLAGVEFARVQPLLRQLQQRAERIMQSAEPALDELVAALDECIDALIALELLATRSPIDAAQAGAPASGVTGDALGATTQRRSARTVQRRLKALTGMSPKRWSALARFRAAFASLMNGDESLAGLASLEGYADQPHMTAEMKRHSGYTPARLRRFARRFVTASPAAILHVEKLLPRVQRLLHLPSK
jgi:AraC-like DNA-binding protein